VGRRVVRLHAEVVGSAIGEIADRRLRDVPDVHRLRVVPRTRPVVDAVSREVRRGHGIPRDRDRSRERVRDGGGQERREEDEGEPREKSHGFEVSAAVTSQDRATSRQGRSRISNRLKSLKRWEGKSPGDSYAALSRLRIEN